MNYKSLKTEESNELVKQLKTIKDWGRDRVLAKYLKFCNLIHSMKFFEWKMKIHKSVIEVQSEEEVSEKITQWLGNQQKWNRRRRSLNLENWSSSQYSTSMMINISGPKYYTTPNFGLKEKSCQRIIIHWNSWLLTIWHIRTTRANTLTTKHCSQRCSTCRQLLSC
jgi:hypothetical protein